MIVHEVLFVALAVLGGILVGEQFSLAWLMVGFVTGLEFASAMFKIFREKARIRNVSK